MESANPPAPIIVDNFQNAQEGIWPNGPVQLARGRQAKDPNAKTVNYSVSTLDEFESSLRDYLNNPPENPEHTECQITFWIGASFMVSTPFPQPTQTSHAPQPPHVQPQQQQQQQQQTQAHHHPTHPQASSGYQPANGVHPPYGGHSQASFTYQSVAEPAIALTLPNAASPSSVNGSNAKDNDSKRRMSILEALAPTSDPKEKMRKQRSIAKCCVDSIQKIDGYRYSFHNCWNSREDDSFRFSYYCNDSLLNKDRAANGKGAKLGKRATKPVYDCKGVLSVKFSAIKQSLDVFYKHIPIHKTYEERAPPPRKDSKRRKFLEENDPEALIRIANRPKPLKPPEGTLVDADVMAKSKKKKTKSDEHKQTATNSIESDLRAQSLRSLLELIQTDPAPVPAQSPDPPKPTVEEQPVQQPMQQTLPQQTRRRPRNSCDVCKVKKTKCDGTRPVCQTCIEKKRQCVYSDGPPEERRQSVPNPHAQTHPNEPGRQAQATNQGLSELEKMKKELEEARARIMQLEAEKTRASTTPSQTSQAVQPPPPSPQTQQQIQNPQHMQNSQYNHFGNSSGLPSYPVNRISQPQNAAHPSQPQSNHQMHPSGASLTTTQDTNNPYSRDFSWSATFYGYQPSQQPADQWAVARNSGAFR